MIEGVKLTFLRIIEDDRGSVRHMLRSDAPHFQGFGEIYFSEVKAGVVKAWHYHKRMGLSYACVAGEVIVGLVDLRPNSPTLGEKETYILRAEGSAYRLLTIPPKVWNGFRIPIGSGFKSAMMANCASLPHDPDEIVREQIGALPIEIDWGPYEIAG